MFTSTEYHFYVSSDYIEVPYWEVLTVGIIIKVEYD